MSEPDGDRPQIQIFLKTPVPQLPSFRRLSPAHQAFVSAYITHGCDAAKAMDFLNPTDPHEKNVRRGWKVMMRDDVKLAIADKLEQHEQRFIMSRDTMLQKLSSLIEKAEALPNAEQKLSTLKFALSSYHEMNKVLGYHQQNINHNETRSIEINLVGVDAEGKPQPEPTIDADAEVLPAPTEDQLALPFPLADPVTYSLGELLDEENELSSEEDGLDEEDLPE